MKRLAISLLFISSFAFADSIQGYPTKIQTTDQGVDFTVSCGPASLSVAESIKKASNDLLTKLSEIQCDVKQIRNPFHRCTASTSTTTPCLMDKARIVHMDKAHSNYQAILTLMSTAYLSQNQVGFDVTKSDENAKEIHFQLQQISLD